MLAPLHAILRNTKHLIHIESPSIVFSYVGTYVTYYTYSIYEHLVNYVPSLLLGYPPLTPKNCKKISETRNSVQVTTAATRIPIIYYSPYI